MSPAATSSGWRMLGAGWNHPAKISPLTCKVVKLLARHINTQGHGTARHSHSQVEKGSGGSVYLRPTESGGSSSDTPKTIADALSC